MSLLPILMMTQVRSLGMPFGGCKESGTGMEGTRSTLEILFSILCQFAWLDISGNPGLWVFNFSRHSLEAFTREKTNCIKISWNTYFANYYPIFFVGGAIRLAIWVGHILEWSFFQAPKYAGVKMWQIWCLLLHSLSWATQEQYCVILFSHNFLKQSFPMLKRCLGEGWWGKS